MSRWDGRYDTVPLMFIYLFVCLFVLADHGECDSG